MSRNFPHIIAKVYREPWLITPQKHRAIQSVLEARMDGILPSDNDADEPEGMSRDGAFAIIPVHGIIGKHLSSIEMECGGCDLDAVNAMISEAEQDDSIETIVFDFRTPGGTVTGVPETGRRIASIAKKTIAFTDSECCSAGYWLASQCKHFYLTETATTGSIGVYSVFEDWSRALENEGVKVNAISSGKYKLAGAYFKPMTDDERTMFQDSVDKLHTQFKEAVRRNREVPDSAMEGQCYDGLEAVEIGLADGLVESIDDLLS